MSWDDLPRDIQCKIISYMDIDTRRALGIICKLRIPQHVVDMITSIPQIQHKCWWGGSCVNLGPMIPIVGHPMPLYCISKHYNTSDTFTEVTYVRQDLQIIHIYGNYYHEAFKFVDSSCYRLKNMM